MARRVHSSIDLLPADLRSTLMAMIVDGAWPTDWPKQKGKPTFLSVVKYAEGKGHNLSQTAVGRWSKRLRFFEEMKETGSIIREVTEEMSAENASATQKAAAEMLTAHTVRLAIEQKLNSKQVKEVAGAIKDCTTVVMQSDQYTRKQLAEKAKAVAASTKTALEGEGIDRAKIQSIIDEILGVVKS